MFQDKGVYVVLTVFTVAIFGIALTLINNNSINVRGDSTGKAMLATDIVSCVDTDGKNYDLKGTVTISSSSPTATSANMITAEVIYVPDSDTGTVQTYIDQCSDDTHVVEYYCSGTTYNAEVRDCGAAKYCSEGACKPRCIGTPTGVPHVAGNVTILSPTTKYTYTDTCIVNPLRRTVFNNRVIENFCHVDGTLGVMNYTCALDCADGRCKGNMQVSSCKDTDYDIYANAENGAIHPDQFGTVSFAIGSALYNYSDFCIESDTIANTALTDRQVSSCTGVNCFIREYYCAKSGSVPMYVYHTKLHCPNGCTAGKCNDPLNIINNPLYCQDSDGGLYIYVRGNVKFNGQTTTDSCFSYSNITNQHYATPSCKGSGCKVAEGLCNIDNTMRQQYVPCPLGCNSGICV